jgi:4-aminobutyrate aminotransferase
MKARHPMIGHVAGLGLHIGIDLVRDRATQERAVEEAEAVMFKCLERGVSFKTIDSNVLTLRPALVITQQEMDRALDIIEEAIGEVERGGSY